jgi:hypothetical protein
MSHQRHWPIDAISSVVMVLFLVGLAAYAAIHYFLFLR